METELIKKFNEIDYKQNLILSALRNILEQNNPNGVNDYLINQIDKGRM